MVISGNILHLPLSNLMSIIEIRMEGSVSESFDIGPSCYWVLECRG